MTSVRSRLTVKQTAEDELLVQISPFRRILYAGISAVLLAGLFSGGVGPLIESGLHFGTIFYGVVVLIALGAAGWNVRTVLDRQNGVIHRARHLFGLTLSKSMLPFDTLEEILLRRIILFRGLRTESSGGRPGMMGIGRGGLSPRRRELGRLYFVPQEARPELIEESTDIAELWTVAEQLSEFTGLNVRSEDL